VTVMADLIALELNSFWVVLDHHGWVHPYDSSGQRQNLGALPDSVARLHEASPSAFSTSRRSAVGNFVTALLKSASSDCF
jgi:hypothetical protein